jgi:hypothetical protein
MAVDILVVVVERVFIRVRKRTDNNKNRICLKIKNRATSLIRQLGL